MTRYLYALINSRSSLNSQVEINDKVRGELQFWYPHLCIMKGAPVRPKSSSIAVVYIRTQAKLESGVYCFLAVTTKLQDIGITTKRIPVRPCVNLWL